MSGKRLFGYSKDLRVRRPKDFEQIHADGRVAIDQCLVVKGIRRACPSGPCRLGLSVGRLVGNAPVRNRWKRLIREAFRSLQHRLPNSLDIVVRPRKDAKPDLKSIMRSLVSLTKQLERQIH
jgi:ribonuclease P protein component